MSKDIGVVFKASDNLTQSLNNMRNSTRNLAKDVTDLKRIQEEAFGKRVDIKYDITKARENLKQLTKDVKSNVEGSEEAWKKQQKYIQELEEEYKNLGKVASEAGSEQRKMQQDISRSNNSSGDTEKGSLMSSLAKAGMGKMLGDSLANAGSALTTSLLGDRAGNAVSSIVGGTASGAAIGLLAGPVGAAIGAGVGAIVGAINAAAEDLKQKDEYFKDEVRTLYDEVKQQQERSLQSGIQSAGALEVNKIAFGTLLGGDENADKFLKDIEQFGSVTPFKTDDLLTISKTLLAYTYKQEEIIPLMTKVGDAGSALGMSPSDINTVATMLGRMKSSGKTTLEYLNPLIERGVPAFDYLAESMGKTREEVQEMVSKGLIPGAEAAENIANIMGDKFAGNMQKQSETYEGYLSTLEDAKARLDRALGEGYNEERKKGMINEIDAMSGEMGQKMEEANRLIGTFKADLENNYQQAIIDSTTNAMNSEDFLKAEQEGNGAEMGRILAEARAKADIEYKNSEGYQLMQQSDLTLVQTLQADVAINGEYLNFGQKMAEQFTKGWSGGIAAAREQGKFTVDISGTQNTPSSVVTSNPRAKGFRNYKPRAIGLDRVPFDGYPALLHEGEKVLTREQADKKTIEGFNINIANMVVREKQDIDKVAHEILYLLNKAKENYGGNP